MRQFDPCNGKTNHAYLWAYRANALDDGPSVVVFDYQPSRTGAHVRSFLQDSRGHLMVDDYGGYKERFAAAPTELVCLAHIRRKFFHLTARSLLRSRLTPHGTPAASQSANT